MTVPSNTSSVTYQGNGAATSFPFAYPVLDTAHLVVTITDTTVAPITQTTLTAGQYGVQGIPGAGTVTYTPALAAGIYITISRVVPAVQETEIPNQGGFYPKVIEAALDYLTMLVQQALEQLSRAVMVPVGRPIDPSSYLATAEAAAATSGANATTASAAAAAAVSAAAAAAASAAALPNGPAIGTGKVPQWTGSAWVGAAVGAGNVVGPASSSPGHVPIFADATGEVLQEGYSVTIAAAASALVMTTEAGTLDLSLIPSSADTAVLQQQILQLYLEGAVNSALGPGGFVSGGRDAYTTDSIGATSTGQTYDATGKYYWNPAAGGGSTSSSTPGSSMSIGTGMTCYDRSWSIANSKTVISVGVYAASAKTVTVKIGQRTAAGAITTVVTQSFSHPGGGWADCTLSTPYAVPASGTYLAGAYYPPGTYDYNSVARTYQTGDITGSSSSFTEDTTGPTGAVRVTYQSTVAPNMTLLSAALSPAPSVAPGGVTAEMLWLPVDTCALNTDLTIELTRDGGTTWTAGTLTDTGNLVGVYHVLKATVDVSAQPSGTSLKYRIKTLNNKQQKVKGIALAYK